MPDESQTSEPVDEGAPPDMLPESDGAAGFFDQLQAHYRECRRKSVDINARIEFVGEDGRTIDTGTSIIRNVSPKGALLADVDVGKDSYPVDRFLINVRMTSGPYAGIGFRCSPVRFMPDDHGIGVKFEEIFVGE